MKRSDIISVLGLFIIFAYVGFREYSVNKFMNKTDDKIRILNNKIIEFTNNQALMGLERNSNQDRSGSEDGSGEEKEEQYPYKISGYFCSSDGSMSSFDNKGNIQFWSEAASSISYAQSTDPEVSGSFRFKDDILQLKVLLDNELKYSILKFLVSKTDPKDKNNETVIEFFNDKLGTYSKSACIK